MTGDAPLLEAEALSKRFGGGLGRKSVLAVAGASLSIRRRETVALVGESGSGKSTLGRLLTRLIEPDTGTIRFDGADVRAMDRPALTAFRARVQMVFQDPMASLNPRHRISTTLTRPVRLHHPGLSRAALRERAAEALREVGLGDEALDRFPHEFSGGQRQRIMIARALSVGPQLLIADEPVSALDVSVQAQIVTLLERLKRDLGLAQLFIAHDLALVRRIADRVVVMYRGRIVETGPTAAVFAAPAHPYTRALLNAAPRIGARPSDAAVIEGEGAGAGCVYAGRCALAEPACRAAEPASIRVGADRLVACIRPLSDASAGPPATPEPARVARIRALHAALSARFEMSD
ncbi:MAG: ABC transporter ATP-binding protein [Pseudomonadota bacterium]